MKKMDCVSILDVAKKAALEAGKKVLEIYDQSEFEVKYKQDKSPLTEADLASNKIIIEIIKKHFSDHGVLSEETIDDKERLKKEIVWIIDPIDGTKEFVKKNGEFAINIAVAYKGKPIVGVINVPVNNELYFASLNKGAFVQKEPEKEQKIKVTNRFGLSNLRLVISRSHEDGENNKITANFSEIKKKGSSLKGCMVANGEADLYFRTNPTNEWDVCAFDLIVKEAGGTVTDLEGQELKYNKKNTLINGFLVSNNQMHEKLLDLVK